MKTRVVSFRLPVKAYAALIVEADEKEIDLSDFIIWKLYQKPQEAQPRFERYDCNFQLRYQSLIESLLKVTDDNLDKKGLEEQYGPGTRMAILTQEFMDHLREELKLLK